MYWLKQFIINTTWKGLTINRQYPYIEISNYSWKEGERDKPNLDRSMLLDIPSEDISVCYLDNIVHTYSDEDKLIIFGSHIYNQRFALKFYMDKRPIYGEIDEYDIYKDIYTSFDGNNYKMINYIHSYTDDEVGLVMLYSDQHGIKQIKQFNDDNELDGIYWCRYSNRKIIVAIFENDNISHGPFEIFLTNNMSKFRATKNKLLPDSKHFTLKRLPNNYKLPDYIKEARGY